MIIMFLALLLSLVIPASAQEKKSVRTSFAVLVVSTALGWTSHRGQILRSSPIVGLRLFQGLDGVFDFPLGAGFVEA